MFKKDWKRFVFLGLSAMVLTACASDETPNEDVESEISSAVVESSSEEVDTSVSSESAVSEESESVSSTGFDGTTLVTEDYTIVITDYKVLHPGEGNNFGETPILAFWYDVTVDEDVTEREIDPSLAWIFTFEAVQDNDPNAINELEVGILPDEAHLDSQSQTIKPGGTVSSSVSYELSDLETPVELTAAEMFGESYGSHTYEIK